MDEIADTLQYYNPKIIKNNRILAGFLFFFQIAITFLYGFFVRPQPTKPNDYDQQLFITVGVAILVLIGFNLVLSIGKNKLWSTLGFNLLITVISYQLYFLVSGLWNHSNISGKGYPENWGSSINVHLTDSDSLNNQTYGETVVGGLKCSLANMIAFAAISGRAGPLEAVVMTVIGTFLYEINRQLVSRYSLDFGGSMTIFCFGGCYGSIISLILFFCTQWESFEEHYLRKAGNFSFLLASVGSLFCWVFFPFLNIDIPNQLIFNFNGGINTFFCISACVVSSVCFTSIINGKFELKYLIYSPIVGGIAAGSSSAIIDNNLSALLLGVGASIIHLIFFKIQPYLRWYVVVQNYVVYIYALIGAFAGLASAIFIHFSSSNVLLDFSSNVINNSNYSNYLIPTVADQLTGVGISMAIGLVGGLIISPFICFINQNQVSDHYHDRAYWIINKDGLADKSLLDFSQEPSSNYQLHLSSEKNGNKEGLKHETSQQFVQSRKSNKYSFL